MKRIFLTGASSGIGLAITQALLARGHEVWGTSRRPEGLARADRFHPVTLDLRKSDQINEAFAAASREAGYFDVVVNNAASGHFGAAEFLSNEEIADQFQVAFFAHVQLMQLALAPMRARDSGLIVNVTSLASRLPVPFMAAYNAAKAAMASFVMSIQIELGSSGVHVIDLQPGDIRTSFNDYVVKKEDASYKEKIARTWSTVDRNMQNAPKPDLVARHICELIERTNPPPRVTVGDFFQSRIAPLIFRFLPQCLRLWGLKRYYGL